MIRYTLGFLFTPDLTRVLLIHKQTPANQKGKVNGLGGKYEPGETPQQCMAREVEEETGLQIHPRKWKKVGRIYSSTWSSDVLAAIYDGPESEARRMEHQEVEWFSVNHLPPNIMSNLSWLIPYSIDILRNPHLRRLSAKYA